VTSTEFPDDATVRIQNAHLVLSQVSGNVSIVSIRALQSTTSQSKEIAVVPSSDEPDAKVIGNASHPTTTILVRNMFDKDKETEPNWQEDIRLDFEEECAKWGKLVDVRVMHLEPGGKIFASFETISQAQTCASNLAGRWFDKRQLRVSYVYGIPDE
jgi:linker between RRM2 and RRM3 domains in RBM39 protein